MVIELTGPGKGAPAPPSDRALHALDGAILAASGVVRLSRHPAHNVVKEVVRVG
jgi:hypothetical protein